MTRHGNIEQEFDRRFDGTVWRRVMGLLVPYRRRYTAIVASMALMAAVEVCFPLVVRHIIDAGVIPGDRGVIYQGAAGYLILVIAQAVIVWAFIDGCGRVGARVMRDLRQQGFTHLQRLSLSFFDKTPSGWIMARLMSDSQRVGETITWGAVDFIWGLTMMALLAATMLTVHWRLALLVLVLVPVMLAVSMSFQKRILRMYRRVRKLNSEITSNYSESIDGIKVIKSLGCEQWCADEFRQLSGTMFQDSFQAALLNALFLPIIHVLGITGTALVVAVGGHYATGGGLTVGTMVAFISYTRRFFDPATEIARVFGQLQETQASAERLFGLLDTSPEIIDTPAAVAGGRIRGAVTFDRVNFSYTGREQVLHDFSLTVEPGDTIALVGPTGGGKSTIVNLLSRFHEPNSGSILVDGVDLRERTIHWLRSQMGIVLQTPRLFSGSIRDNIRYGRLEATDGEVEQAAGRAGAHGFVTALENGYETLLHDGGAPLSTGQKQLISLARAILADPAILIMDEATSSVDQETEHDIQTALEALLQGRTSFIIAHRLSTIRNADRILFIENGRIVEAGTHHELLARRARYCAMHTRQFLGEDLSEALP
ncbi:ABC transporter ATP-binding protein [bacterium]|nr:ABC transporter ATP-binding protein [candidate division CSSED10-310 bacterium]